MALHEVQLKGYSVRPGNLSLGTFDSYGIEQLHVTADDSWDGLDILAVFHAPNGDAKKVVVGADGMLNVPPEATAKQAGNGRIVFVGLAENVQRITVDMGYNIKPHSDIEGDNPGVPTPDVVQQILQAALNAEQNSEEAKSVADGLRNDAANGKFNGKDGAKGDKGETGTTPQLKIGEDNLWQVSYDNGAAWVSLGVKATGEAGKDGEDGKNGLTPHIGENGNWWVGDTDTGVSAKGDRGDTGAKGADGVSPTASVTQTDNGAEFTVTDASGTTTAMIRNGTDGRDGAPGAPGKDAVVDATLTQDGQAADAKVTGEKIGELKEDTAALKKRQNVLVGSETGNPVSCDDAFAAPLCGLHIYGKSTQDGTPTPDAPVPIVSAGDGGSVVVKVSDGNGKEQTLTLSTPNGLPGIPVTSGGNYTDQSGQQWVCDEVDFERSILIRRIYSEIYTGAERWQQNNSSIFLVLSEMARDALKGTAISNIAVPCSGHLELSDSKPVGLRPTASGKSISFFFANNVQPTLDDWKTALSKTNARVQYVLQKPIESKLTDAELAAYKALTAYAPDTVVQASDGAGIKLDYQRDVNLVIKNLEDAIASMTTT